MPKCRICKQKYEPKFNSLEPCPNIECRTILFNQALERVRDNKHKELKESHKKKHKTLSEYEAEAKKAFQRWIRERDFGMPCISCGNPKPKEVHASHFYSAGQYSGLIFDEDNVHGACDYCNVFLHGNLLEYRRGLIKRYGVEFMEALEARSDGLRKRKYTREELIEIKAKYSKRYEPK